MRFFRPAAVLLISALALMMPGCKNFFVPRIDTPTSTAKAAYVANFNGGNAGSISVLTIDSTSGGLTSASTATTGAAPKGDGAAALITVSGKFVYSANDGGGVSGFVANATGALTAVAGSPFTAGTNPTALTVDITNKFLYVANSGSNDVDAYTIDSNNGILTPLAGSPYLDTANGTASGVTAHPNGKFLYVAEDSLGVDLWQISTDGTLRFVSNLAPISGARPQAIVFSPSGNFAYVADGVNNVDVYAVNTTSGALTPLSGTSAFAAGPSGGQVSPIAIAIDTAGSFIYTANRDGNSVSAFAVLNTGALTAVVGSPFTVCPASTTTCAASPTSLRIEPSGKFLYATSFNSPGITFYSFSASTAGALVQAGTATAGTNPSGIAFK